MVDAGGYARRRGRRMDRQRSVFRQARVARLQARAEGLSLPHPFFMILMSTSILLLLVPLLGSPWAGAPGVAHSFAHPVFAYCQLPLAHECSTS